jgi:hypothetical protein
VYTSLSAMSLTTQRFNPDCAMRVSLVAIPSDLSLTQWCSKWAHGPEQAQRSHCCIVYSTSTVRVQYTQPDDPQHVELALIITLAHPVEAETPTRTVSSDVGRKTSTSTRNQLVNGQTHPKGRDRIVGISQTIVWCSLGIDVVPIEAGTDLAPELGVEEVHVA